MLSLKNKTVFITGASSGIGKACAREMAKLGARVILTARRIDRIETLAKELHKNYAVDVLALCLDIRDKKQVEQAVCTLEDRWKEIDILVNNAAITRDGLAVRMKPEDWDAVLRTNLTGAHLCAQQALSTMMRARYGRIINVTSVVAKTGNAGQVNYVAAKAGLIGLTRALALEIASRNITVNAVAPGFIVSPMTDPLPQNAKDALLARIPLGRMGCDAEVAAAILFLASEEAGYITGVVLDVNGGLRMG